MLIGIIIDIMLIRLMKIMSIVLGITHNKPDIKPMTLTTIGIMIAIEAIKTMIRIEDKQGTGKQEKGGEGGRGRRGRAEGEG